MNRLIKITVLQVIALLLVAFGFLGRGRGEPGDDLSSIIYPKRDHRLRVNHLHPEHRSLRCERCHISARRSSSAADRLIPPESACEPCHAERIDRDQNSAYNCGFCHHGYDPAVSSALPISNLPRPRIHFSHAKHANRHTECTRCHHPIEKEKEVGRYALPDMRSCLTCHEPLQGTGCAMCHLADPAGRLRLRFPQGQLKPPGWLLGMRHDRDWTVRHRWVGADNGDFCSACHRENDCLRCHDGRRRPSGIHPNDWLTLHSQRSRRRTPRCTSCHTTQTFCAECHARLGITPSASPNVRSERRLHPPKSEWIQGATRHAREAKRSLASCTGCHVERDCVICHGSRGLKRGVSPHQKGFDKVCGTLLEKNSRACKVCHQDPSSLVDRCRPR
ncbi:MAG: hypothetical protein JXA30_13980 [Deltaproteobacteria bacterium]|nr:hypothetical protein [Deltaproteobacteria bacterium]